mmetsp:Transcript_14430/g.16680  ORF Transcript_14430/g.16680 Transcript_14430/m.16680 type:complete len:128 (+) Transcript_14430:2994-3377(+)
MIEYGTKADISEKQKIKVEDKRVTREVYVKLITDKTIEVLLNYLQLLPEDNKYTLDKKLNQIIRYNAGVKPNKMMKSIVPVKAEVVDKDSSDDETNSPRTGRDKTEKTEKTEQTEQGSDDDGKTSRG